MMNNIFRNSSSHSSGWEYISAIFCYFQDYICKSNDQSHIAPKFIYRGITKRYYTESVRLNNIIDAFNDNQECVLEEYGSSKEIKDFCIEAAKSFKDYAKKHAKDDRYDNTHPLRNNLTLSEIKKQKTSEILYNIIYKGLNDRICKRICEQESQPNSDTNIRNNIVLLKDIHQWTEKCSNSTRAGAFGGLCKIKGCG